MSFYLKGIIQAMPLLMNIFSTPFHPYAHLAKSCSITTKAVLKKTKVSIKKKVIGSDI
jgi:hypothetical protein